MRTAGALAAFLFPFFSLTHGLRAQETSAISDAKCWGALVYAHDEEPAGASVDGAVEGDAHFSGISARLSKVFSEKHFALLGQHTQDIFREYESWVVPSKELFLKVDSKGPAETGGMQLHIQLWHDKKVIVKTDAILKHDSPLFIGGPKWREGRLVFVVMLANGG